MEILADTRNKSFMFNLGRLFAKGESITIKNIKELAYNIRKDEAYGYSKSFNLMLKYWQDNNLTPNIRENTEIVSNKIFLICPVRNATQREIEILNNTIDKYENQDFIVHYPQQDTNQDPFENGINTGGYNICLENARAIYSSPTVVIHYNRSSTGSMFDLGVCYELMTQDHSRKLILENSIKLDPKNFIDHKILEMLEMSKSENTLEL